MKNKRIFNYLFTGVFLALFPAGITAQSGDYNYATGQVKGRNYVGGLIGRIASGTGEAKNSYARGSVTGEMHVGGFAGSNNGAIDKCYSTGKVTGNSNFGGLAGSNTGSVSNSYWDTQTSAQPASAGGTARNTTSMIYPYDSNTFTGWDFAYGWKPDLSPARNNGYPLLAASGVFQVSVQVYPPGAGTAAGEGYYREGQQVQLKATAAQAYIFKGWQKGNGIVSTQLQYTMSVIQDTRLVARFESKSTSIQADLPLISPKMKVYPNPAGDILWADFSSVEKEVTTVSVVNMVGQTVKQFIRERDDSNRLSFNISDLKPGVYVVIVRYDKGVDSEKFVKK